jgi:phage virion morphogenesis protein
VSLTIDMRELPRSILHVGKLAKRALDVLPHKIGAIVEAQTERRLTYDKRDPTGKRWPKWSDRYAATRHSEQSLLEASGLLASSLTNLVHNNGSVEVGADRIYAATHQYGDPDRGIPARPYLGLSTADKAELRDTIETYLQGLLP